MTAQPRSEMPAGYRVVSGELRARGSGRDGYRGERSVVSPVVIERRWPRRAGVLLLGFAGFWLSLCTFMGRGLLESRVVTSGNVLVACVFLVFVVIGLLVAYFGLVATFNRTVFEVTARTLSVRHEPLPLRGVRMPVERVRALAVVRKEVHDDAGIRIVSRVAVRDGDGREVLILENLETEDEAIFLAGALAEHLGVEVELPG